jgi:hypothetical protein
MLDWNALATERRASAAVGVRRRRALVIASRSDDAVAMIAKS